MRKYLAERVVQSWNLSSLSSDAIFEQCTEDEMITILLVFIIYIHKLRLNKVTVE